MWQIKYAKISLKIWDWDLIFGCEVKAISSQGVHNSCAKPLPMPCFTPKNQGKTKILPVLLTTGPLLKGLSSLNVQQEHFIHARSGGVAGISALCSTFGHCCLWGYDNFSADVLIDMHTTPSSNPLFYHCA